MNRRGIGAAACLLGLATASSAAVYTVGTGGDYVKIQAAVGLAVSAGGSNEVRVRQGTYLDRVNVSDLLSSGESLSITGGWNKEFDTRTPDPNLTVVDATSGGVALAVSMSGGSLTVDGFTFKNGRTVNSNGAGMQLNPTGDSHLDISHNRIVNNHASSMNVPGVEGGGLSALLQDTAFLYLSSNLVSNNLMDASSAVSGSFIGAAGMYVRAVDEATFDIEHNVIEENELHPLAQGAYAAVELRISASAFGEFSNNIVRSNQIADGSDYFVGTGIFVSMVSSNILAMRRNLVLGNSGEDEQVRIDLNNGIVRFSDSVIADGPSWGLSAYASDGGSLYLTNLTIAGNGGGIPDSCCSVPTGTVYMHNSILYDELSDFIPDGVSVSGNNLVGVDPHFVDAAAHDYRVYADSPAFNMGTNSPPGLLGPLDLSGQLRIQDGTVDIGAYEGGVPVPSPTPTITPGGPTPSPTGPTLTPTSTVTPEGATLTPTPGAVATLSPRSGWPFPTVCLAAALTLASRRRRRKSDGAVAQGPIA